MIDTIPSQSILTQEQLAAVGCVAIESTYAEAVIEEVIWDLCGLDEEHGKHLTNGVQMKNRLTLLSSLGKMHLSKEKTPPFVKIISDLKLSNEDRNTVIHGFWERVAPDGSVAFLEDNPDRNLAAQASKRRLNKDPLKRSAAEVMAIAARIFDLRNELLYFVEDTWPDTWQRRFQLPPEYH